MAVVGPVVHLRLPQSGFQALALGAKKIGVSIPHHSLFSMGWVQRWCFLLISFGHVVRAARPWLEPSMSDHWGDPCEDYEAKGVKQKGWKKWFQTTDCVCLSTKQSGSIIPSEGCGALHGERSFKLKDVPDPGMCECVSEDPCEKHGAQSLWTPTTNVITCDCSPDFPSKGCGASDQDSTFKLKDVQDQSCKCIQATKAALERSLPVEVSALKFCSAVVKEIVFRSFSGIWESQAPTAKKLLSSKLCTDVLTGAASSSGEWYSPAAQLSEHPGSHGLGHLDPLVPSTSHHLLKHVCKDECQEIVNETIKNIELMAKSVYNGGVPPEQTCADRVVRKVEAEILGCCGRSCGWNNRSCTAWPFFNKSEKVMWLEECCTELNVLNGSSRERMCDSVLTPEQVRLVSTLNKYTKAKSGTDVAGVFIGQDPRLLWTADGLSEFKDEVKKLKRVPKDGDLVDSEFLEDYPNVQEEGLHKGWFQQEEIIGDKTGSTSFVQADGCNLKGMGSCPDDTKQLKIKTCMAGEWWQASDKPDPDMGEESCQMILNNKAAVRVATPDDCLRAKFSIEEFGTITRRFFEYKEFNTKKIGKELQDVIADEPILCYVDSAKFTCGDFDRKKFQHYEQELLDSSTEFHDLRYWIDEKDVPKRLKQVS